SRDEHHLADALARLDELVRAIDLGERDLRADHRLQCPRLPEREQFPDRLPDDLGLVSQEPPEIETLHADVAPHERGRAELRPHAARKADGDERPERPQKPERALEELAADR